MFSKGDININADLANWRILVFEMKTNSFEKDQIVKLLKARSCKNFMWPRKYQPKLTRFLAKFAVRQLAKIVPLVARSKTYTVMSLLSLQARKFFNSVTLAS